MTSASRTGAPWPRARLVGLFVTVTAKTATDVAERIPRDALDVRCAAAEIRA